MVENNCVLCFFKALIEQRTVRGGEGIYQLSGWLWRYYLIITSSHPAAATILAIDWTFDKLHPSYHLSSCGWATLCTQYFYKRRCFIFIYLFCLYSIVSFLHFLSSLNELMGRRYIGTVHVFALPSFLRFNLSPCLFTANEWSWSRHQQLSTSRQLPPHNGKHD